MTDKTHNLTTTDLWIRLFSAPSIDSFLSETENSVLPAFADYITDLVKARGERAETIIRRSNLESSFGHRLFAGTRNPSRDTVLQLAFGLELTSDETQPLLKVARVTVLHPKVKRDAVIAYAPNQRYADAAAVRKALLAANPGAQEKRIALSSLCVLSLAVILALAGHAVRSH